MPSNDPTKRTRRVPPAPQPSQMHRPSPVPPPPPIVSSAPMLTDEQLAAALDADSRPQTFISGFDPALAGPQQPRVHQYYPPTGVSATSYPPVSTNASYVPASLDPRGEETAEKEYYEYDDEDELDEDDVRDEDDDDEMMALSSGARDIPPWGDVQEVPLPPTAMPVEYTAWLDLGEIEDVDLARKYRGWKIKCRKDYSLAFLEAAEALQEAARAAKRLQRDGRGTVRAEVRVSHIRAVLQDVVVAWNFVDERGYPLQQPPNGLRQIRGDLLAATLNCAISQVVPPKARSKRSTRR